MSGIAVNVSAQTLAIGTLVVPCVIGKGGSCTADVKREGDGCTPMGRWPLRGALLRPGRGITVDGLAIPWRWARPGDGWSDDMADPAYNRPVQLPHPFSAEKLQRDDAAYDVIIVLGHNDAPPWPGAGSAIFFHIWVERRPTEGCVAIAKADMIRLLPLLRSGMVMEIGQAD